MRIISNTGPIIGLAKINLLFLLGEFASDVFIPPMVYRELLAKIGSEAELIDKALKDVIKVIDLKPLAPAVEKALSDLDEGEREVIGLASTMPGDILALMDDRAGREAAERLSLPVSGSLGILLLAKHKGILKTIGPLLEELRIKGYWLSDEVMLAARRLADET